jgi:hypothetical protein
MPTKSFKDIIDKRGYKVSKADRAIFEREIGKSYFGMGVSDMIEFILYDSNNNQLPQGDSKLMVRYIPLDAENIRRYFLITQNPTNRRLNGASEYIIDVEKLIVEAGYSNGIFKSQVTLLNRRVGSETIEKDKLWIHEISPSRTEIRVLPLEDRQQRILPDLQERLNIILNKRDFRDDTIYFVKSMVDSIKVADVLKTFLTINGSVVSGENYVKLIQAEFKIQSWDLFVNQIREKLIEGAQYFVENRDWNISSNNYGKPLSTPRNLELSVSKIVETLNSILIKVIDKYLPKRTYQDQNILTLDEQITLDEVKQLLKTVTSGTKYDTDQIVISPVRGCTNPNAKNYNPLATVDDGSCVFERDNNPGDGQIPRPSNQGRLITKTWYGWKDGSKVKYLSDKGGSTQTFNEFDEFKLTYYEGSFDIAVGGDVREVPKTAIDKSNESTGTTTTGTTTTGTTPSSTTTGAVVNESVGTTSGQLTQQQIIDKLIEQGNNTGFAPGVQIRPGGPGYDAKE